MNSAGLSDSLSSASRPKCEKCGATMRLETGVCASCLLREGLGTVGGMSRAAYESVLAEADVPDTQWHLGNYEILDEIAMENSAAMGVLDSTRHLCHQLRTLSRFVAKRRCRVMQASACREFHAEKRKAVLAFAHLVHRKNVRMIQASYRFGIASETLERLVRIGLVT